jgi:Ca-activated chloride channel family protein
MREYLLKHKSLLPLMSVAVFSLLWLLFLYEGAWSRLLVTSDQLGYNYFKNGEYLKAAKSFENSSFKAASFYRAGEYKKSKMIYQNSTTKVDTYNLGNAFLMLGEYDHAIETYKRALKIDPNFKEAQENLKVAEARKILKEPENDGEEGVGELGADEIVYDNKAGKGVDDDKSAKEEATSTNPHWLDRLQTGPKDFLKNKFRYQYEMQESRDVE